jgi:hypothetical protein
MRLTGAAHADEPIPRDGEEVDRQHVGEEEPFPSEGADQGRQKKLAECGGEENLHEGQEGGLQDLEDHHAALTVHSYQLLLLCWGEMVKGVEQR